MYSLRNVRFACITAGLSLILGACTKTVTNPYPAASKSRITSFRIVNTDTPIAGIVDDNDHTITVYLPPASFFTILAPKITVSEGASINLANDGYIEDLRDYFAKGRKIEYTVTGADKSTTVYSLKLISQQPTLGFTEITTDVANPVTYNHTISWYSNDITLYTSTPYYFSSSSTVSEAIGQVTLVSESGTEYPMITTANKAPGYAGAQSAAASYVNISLAGIAGYNGNSGGTNKTSPPAGLYWIKVQYYSQIVQLKNPIRIVYE